MEYAAYNHKIKLICHNNNILSILNFVTTWLKPNTIKRIEKGNLDLRTYAQVFLDAYNACPSGDGFDEYVNKLLNDQNYIIRLETNH